MSHQTALTPSVSIATAYKVAQYLQSIQQYNQALQPVCSQSGTNQTATPQVSPAR